MISSDSSKALLQSCLKQIEGTLGWTSSGEWRHSHFEKLSQLIEGKTSVLLSVTTLKRIWGKVHYASAPSMTTLNTLAQFLDYNDWDAFAMAQKTLAKTAVATKKYVPQLKRRSFPLLFIGICLLILFSIISFSIKPNKIVTDNSDVQFSFKPLSTGIPNTVTFTYDLEGVGADSFFIQQSWDPRLRHAIDPKRNFHAVTYYYPGFFKAKLIANETILEEKDLLLPSDGWMGVIESHPVPYYIPQGDLIKSSAAIIDEQTVSNLKQFKNENKISSRLYLVGAFDPISADTFTFETSFRHIRLGNEGICGHSQVVLYTTAGAIVMPSAIKGCAAELALIVPGRSFMGTSFDLSGFGANTSEWTHLKLVKSGSTLIMYANDVEAFKLETTMDYGSFTGVKYYFDGGGAVQMLKILKNGQVLYQDDFSSVVRAL